MDKSILRNFAIYSRNKLLQDVINKGKLIGISEKGIEKPLSESVDMLTFDIKASESYKIHGKQVGQYKRLIEEIRRRENNSGYQTAYDSIVEEVAYTWFNRLIAIRFMEVNNYLPDKMKVLSSGRPGVDEPEFLTYYDDTSLEFTSKELDKILELKLDGSAKSMEEIFHLIFIKECNRLNDYLPELFEKIDDYAELLLNISYIDEEGVLYKLVHDIPEEYFDIESENENGQVEIIGWMYQYYNSERKDEVFSRPKTAKIQKDDIAPATQLFTPDWIVRYMVENSLGRLWVEKLVASGDKRTEKQIAKDFNWKYYIPEAEQEDAMGKLFEIRKDRKDIKLEEIKFIDPAMGSFHIGVYAFDVFMQLYESQGYTTREGARLIIESNLYGIDIDKRAYQLSYFALMMKGRQYNRQILNKDIKTNLYSIMESNHIKEDHLNYFGASMKNEEREFAQGEIEYLLKNFYDAREYGSILKIDDLNWNKLDEFIDDLDSSGQISFESHGIQSTQKELKKIIDIGKILSDKYDLVVTNPPYMGSSGMNPKLKKYLDDNYSDSKSDLFAVFMEKCKELTKISRYYALITQHSWMFLSSYEKLREKLKNNTIQNMVHLGPRAFEEIGGEVVQTTSFVFKNTRIKKYKGSYIRLVDYPNAKEKEIKTLEAIEDSNCGYYYETEQDNFEKIPGMPVAYWASEMIINLFENKPIGELFPVKKGSDTGNNEKFLRFWYEVKSEKIGRYLKSGKDSIRDNKKWVPYDKGGWFKKWYGNNDLIINWENDGLELKNSSANLRSKHLFFKDHITWNALTSSTTSARYSDYGALFDSAGSSMFPDNLLIYLGYMNSKVVDKLLLCLNPTLNYGAGTISNLPEVIETAANEMIINNIVKQNISISRTDWDTFETSWDFKVSSLANFSQYMDNYYDSLGDIGVMAERETFYTPTMEEAYKHYKDLTNSQFAQLKANEEELNRIFIEIYGLQEELTPEVSDRDITIAKIFDTKEEIDEEIKGNRYVLTKEDVVKQFISYAVGCIFGRYSLDEQGLAYAGGEFDNSKYKAFIPSKDNIILITDEEYLENDIVSRFVDFIEAVYGKENLGENLHFIGEALGGNGEPKDIIRNYFLKDFYKDHVKTYQKRPIYWLYDSGKQNGLKALIYMHRYHEDTTGKVRISYLHEMQKAYERIMDNLRYDIANNENPRQVAQAEKRLNKLTKQLKECKDYDEAIGHLALSRIAIDLDDGVKVNYEKVQTDEKGKKLQILAKI